MTGHTLLLQAVTLMTEGRLAKHSARVIVRSVAALLCSLLIACVPLNAQPAELSPGDWLKVKTTQVPNLSGHYQVSEAGSIDFPVVGSLEVAGLDLATLEQQLEDALVEKGYQRPIDIALQPAAALTPAVATSTPAHPLQPGDVLVIEVAGEPAISGRYTVKPSGTIILPMVGEIPVTDLTVEELTGVLTQRLKQFVVQPAVSVNLLSAIPRLVNIVGQVSRPGLYPVDQTPTALALLAAAGGVLPNGDLAAAMLFREGTPQKLAPQGLLAGDILPGDVPLKRGDTLVVPVRPPEIVLVVGAAQTPGAIPLERANNLSRAILLAGGPSELADPAQAYILRGTERIDVDLRDVMGDNPAGQGSSAQITLQPDDVIVIPPSTGRDPVYVIGAVNAPGPKLAKSARTLSAAIVVSGGITKAADLADAYVMRQGQRLEVDLAALIEQGDASADLPLQPGDAVVVPSTPKQIYVAGRVSNPGAYPSEEAKTVLDLWSLVGSALPDADLHNCTVLRGQETISVDIEALVNQGDMSQNIAIQPGDKLVVSEIRERVYVLGQVARPGAYPIKEGDTLMDILGKAGGPTVMADTGKMVLMRRKAAETQQAAPPEGAETAHEQAPAEVRREPHHKPATFSIGNVLQQKGPTEERRAVPAEKELGIEEEVSLRILAAAQWQDVAMRPRPGDVIYIPARREKLTTTDYLRILLNTLPYLLFR